MPVAPWRAVNSPEEAVAAAEALGYPVVLKLAAAALIHKTEAGGVLLNLQDRAAVLAAYQQTG